MVASLVAHRALATASAAPRSISVHHVVTVPVGEGQRVDHVAAVWTVMISRRSVVAVVAAGLAAEQADLRQRALQEQKMSKRILISRISATDLSMQIFSLILITR